MSTQVYIANYHTASKKKCNPGEFNPSHSKRDLKLLYIDWLHAVDRTENQSKFSIRRNFNFDQSLNTINILGIST